MAESVSSGVVLRCFAPPFLTEAFKLAETPIGTPKETLFRRIALIEVVLRYGTAVLASELARLGLQRPKAFETLLRHEAPTLGVWSKACNALAQSLEPSRRDLVDETFVRFWMDEQPPGKPVRDLIDQRNDLTHSSDGIQITNDAEALELLPQIDENLRAIANGLRTLDRRPIFCIEPTARQPGMPLRPKLLRFRGSEVEHLEEEGLEGLDAIKHNMPFLLGRNGTALSLWPFVLFREVASDRLPLLLLYWRDNRYTAAGRREPVEDSAAAAGVRAGRHEPLVRVVSPEVAERLCGTETWDTRAPQLHDLTCEKLLGHGASGAVYLARDAQLHRVAVKVIGRNVLDSRQCARLEREYATLKSLQHPAIVKALDLRSHPTTGPYLVFEYVDGLDLEAVVSKNGPFDPKKALGIVSQVLDALRAAHARPIFHRDIKPANIVLDAESNAHLIDFGIALDENAARLTKTLDAVGTFPYSAPEQIHGQPIDARADLYSVGRVLLFLCMGQLSTSDGLPDEVRAIVRRATHREASQRYSSAAEMLEDVRQALRGSGPPIKAPDRLDDSYEVHALVAQHGSVWVFRGVEIASHEPRGVLVTTDEAARDQLLRVPQHVKKSVGWAGAHRTADQLSYVILGADDLDARVRAVLEGRTYSSGSASTEATTSTARVTSSAVVAVTAQPALRSDRTSRLWIGGVLMLVAVGAGAAYVGRSNPRVTMKRIGGGMVRMGKCTEFDKENWFDLCPEQTTKVAPFMMDVHEVTVEAYRECMKSGGCSQPVGDGKCNIDAPGHDTHPINCATALQARAYCSWAGKRLPTSAEWEMAAHGVDRVYPWGEEAPTAMHANYSSNGTTPVGSFPKGATPDGLLDMAGNVWEWTDGVPLIPPHKLPSHDPKSKLPKCDVEACSAAYGGSFAYPDNRLFAFRRIVWNPTRATSDVGFRCAKDDDK